MANLWNIYSYGCEECGVIVLVQGSPRRGDSLKCPQCGKEDVVESISGDCRDEESEIPLECTLPRDFC